MNVARIAADHFIRTVDSHEWLLFVTGWVLERGMVARLHGHALAVAGSLKQINQAANTEKASTPTIVFIGIRNKP